MPVKNDLSMQTFVTFTSLFIVTWSAPHFSPTKNFVSIVDIFLFPEALPRQIQPLSRLAMCRKVVVTLSVSQSTLGSDTPLLTLVGYQNSQGRCLLANAP